jgi:hypothetical protein
MVNVNLKPASSAVDFDFLQVGATFVIKGSNTLYQKVVNIHGEEFQVELATGKAYPPSNSWLMPVAVEINEV